MCVPWFSLFRANTVSCCRAPREHTGMAHFQYCRYPIHLNSQRSWRGAPGRIWQTLRDNSRRSCKPIPVGVARAWITRSGNQGETRRRRQICLTRRVLMCFAWLLMGIRIIRCVAPLIENGESVLCCFCFLLFLFQRPLLNKLRSWMDGTKYFFEDTARNPVWVV